MVKRRCDKCEERKELTKMYAKVVESSDKNGCKWRDVKYYCSDKCLKEDNNG